MARPSSSVRRTAALVFYNIAATVVLLLALEGMANVYYAFHDAFAERPLTERLFTQYDRELGWVSLPNIYIPNVFGPGKYLRTNSQRFRSDTDFTPTVPPGKTRIICSGDSFTFGYGVDNDHAWPQSLAAVAPNIQAVNMGQGGYGADQAYLWYKRDGAALDHDIQILAVITPDLFRMQSLVIQRIREAGARDKRRSSGYEQCAGSAFHGDVVAPVSAGRKRSIQTEHHAPAPRRVRSESRGPCD